ncbi:DUF4339 domain-containing protein [Hymenobacter sp. CRA2]|uniref:DUF4339 domain-containing protein n=1 Tax=Hymenobacter sp. CRA2 TaxID=1955620 RepID=UPI00158FB1A5|nr:DUF4339 domain-containing protein [Hymenobacter sp. CRA2]
MKLFYYVQEGRACGPATTKELQRLGITPGTLVWAEGMTNWVPAGALPELRIVFLALSPAVSPSPVLAVPAPASVTKNTRSIGGQVLKAAIKVLVVIILARGIEVACRRLLDDDPSVTQAQTTKVLELPVRPPSISSPAGDAAPGPEEVAGATPAANSSAEPNQDDMPAFLPEQESAKPMEDDGFDDYAP